MNADDWNRDRDEFRRWTRVVVAAVVVWGLFLLLLVALGVYAAAKGLGIIQ